MSLLLTIPALLSITGVITAANSEKHRIDLNALFDTPLINKIIWPDFVECPQLTLVTSRGVVKVPSVYAGLGSDEVKQSTPR